MKGLLPSLKPVLTLRRKTGEAEEANHKAFQPFFVVVTF